MTDSFIFNPSPDYASALGETYGPVNESYDRREELERLNDEVRKKNAELPLDILKKLIPLLPKAKKLANKMAWDKYNKDAAEENPWKKGTKEYETYEALQKYLDEGEKLHSEMVGDAYKNKDIPTLNALKADGIGTRKKRNIVFNSDKVTWKGDLQQYIFDNNRTLKFKDLDEANDFFNRFVAAKKKNLIAAGFNSKYIDFFGKDEFEKIRGTFISKVEKSILGDQLQDNKSEDIQYINNASKGENFNADIYKWADLNKGKFNNNVAEALRYKIKLMTTLNRADQLPYAVTESFLYSITEAKGDIAKTVVEKLGGSVQANMQVKQWLETLEASKTKALEAITTRDDNYKKTYEMKLRETLYKDGNVPTKEELINYIYKDEDTRFDFSTGGLPQEVTKLLSAEAQNDAQLIPLYEKKARLGILTVADVMKLESSTLRQQYLPQAISVSNMGMSKQITSMSKEAIKTMADEVEKDSIGKTEKSSKWLSIKQQAELLYPSLYAQNLKIAEPDTEKGLSREAVAHAETMKQLYAKAIAGNFDTWGEFTTNRLKMQSALQYLALDKNHLTTQIIPGFEADVKAAMDLPFGSKTVLTAFKQLSEETGIPAALLQANQVTAARKLEEAGKLQAEKEGSEYKAKDKEYVKSEIELAYEALSEDQKNLLSKYPTQAKLARAKFLAFIEDSGEGEGVITWNELSVVHPDVSKFIFKEQYGKDLPEPHVLGKYEPQKGDWKELPGATRIGYAVFDGKNWVYSSKKGWVKQGNNWFNLGRLGNEWMGDIDEYRDRDGYYKPFEGGSNDLTTTFFGRDKPINTAEEGGPRIGDWYRITNKNVGPWYDLAGIANKPFVVWDGKEWIQQATKGKYSKEYQGPHTLSKIKEEEKNLAKNKNKKKK